MRYLSGSLIFILLACSHQPQSTANAIDTSSPQDATGKVETNGSVKVIENSQPPIYEGVVVINSDIFNPSKDTLQLFYENRTYARIQRSSRTMDFEINRVDVESNKSGLRIFFTDYDIVVFDARKENGTIWVLFDNVWMTTNLGEFVEFYSWENYLLEIFIVIDDKSPLKISPDSNASIIKNYEQNAYEVLEVKGDWARVRCVKDCEGCFENEASAGWVRWRQKQHLLVELYHTC